MEEWRRFLRENPLFAAVFMASGMSLILLIFFGVPLWISLPLGLVVFGIQYQREHVGASRRPLILVMAAMAGVMVIILAIKSIPR